MSGRPAFRGETVEEVLEDGVPIAEALALAEALDLACDEMLPAADGPTLVEDELIEQQEADAQSEAPVQDGADVPLRPSRKRATVDRYEPVWHVNEEDPLPGTIKHRWFEYTLGLVRQLFTRYH